MGIGGKWSSRVLPSSLRARLSGGAGLLAWNVMWNWAGMGINILTGFLVAPFLIHRLGDTTYSLWILIASLTGYFGLLDLGVRGSVGRQIAYFRAREDADGVNRILSTALAILCIVAVVALAATVLVSFGFFRIFEVPADQMAGTRLALIIVGVNLAITFPVTVFDGLLWGYERFDLLNAVDIPTTLLRTVLTFLIIDHGDGLVGLAVITFICTAGSALAKAAISFRVNPATRLRLAYVQRGAAGQLYGYGIWHFLLSVAQQVNQQTKPVLIGWAMTVALIAPFSIATRLIGYASAFLVACTGVLTPVSTALHAREDHARQQKLFIDGGKYCMAFSLYFAVLFLFLGQSLIRLWVGPAMAKAAYLPLAILTIGEILPMGQWLTYGTILAMAKHRLSAIVGFVESAIAITIALLLERPYGLAGICIGFAAASVLCRGVFQIVYGCSLVRLPVERYVVRALLPALGVACLPAIMLGALVRWRQPDSWVQLMATLTVYSTIYLIAAALILVGWRRLRPSAATEAGMAVPAQASGVAV